MTQEDMLMMSMRGLAWASDRTCGPTALPELVAVWRCSIEERCTPGCFLGLERTLAMSSPEPEGGVAQTSCQFRPRRTQVRAKLRSWICPGPQHPAPSQSKAPESLVQIRALWGRIGPSFRAPSPPRTSGPIPQPPACDLLLEPARSWPHNASLVELAPDTHPGQLKGLSARCRPREGAHSRPDFGSSGFRPNSGAPFGDGPCLLRRV